MPNLKRSAFKLAEVPSDIKPSELVFQVPLTKEIFRDYPEYVERMKLYKQKVWACKVTGKANLTYEQALQSESKASEQVQNFPKEFVAPVLQMVQFSPLCVSDIVDKLYKRFKDHYVEGELVEAVSEDGSIAPCRVVRILEEQEQQCESERCSCTYEVEWLKDEGTSQVTGQNMKRKKPPLTKSLLKSFIRESATIGVSKGSRWVVHGKLARQYNIPLSPPEELDENEASDLRSSERSGEAIDEEEEESGGKGKRKRTSSNGSAPRIKYPIEDSLLPSSEASRPSPCSDFVVPMECAGDLLMVWYFCISFAKVLDIYPYSLDDFEEALCYKDGESVLLAECHHALLKAVVSDASAYELLNNNKKRRKRELTVETWRNDLADLIQRKGSEKLRHYEAAIREGAYQDLEPSARLEILSELTEWSLCSSLIKSQLDEHIPRRKDSGKDKKKKAAETLDEDDDDLPPPLPNGSAYKGSDVLKSFKRKKAPEKTRKQREEERAEAEAGRCSLRSTLLGQDRFHNRYWFFPEGRVFVESEDGKTWGFYSEMTEFDAFYNSLNSKGVREKALKEQIDLHYDSISSAIESSSDKLLDEASRGRGRGKSFSRSG